MSGKKILLVEDDMATARMAGFYLKAYGELTVIHDGQEAILKLTEAFAKNQPYDLYCFDINLGKMTGHEVLAHLRELETDYPHACKGKVMMLTGYDDMENITRSFEYNCDQFVSKPVNEMQIRSVMVSLEMVDGESTEPV